MASKVIEIIYGKRFKYEVREVDGYISKKFVIYRNGTRWKGDYNSLSRAVEVAEEAG
jgi:hypothetical protein